jgi:hypothetical protein
MKFLAAPAFAVLFACAASSALAQSEPQAVPTTPIQLTKPAVGSSDSAPELIPTAKGFFAVWQRVTNGSTAILGQSFDAKGKPDGKPITLKPAGFAIGTPKVASLGGNKAAILWQNMVDVEGSVVDLKKGKASKPKLVAKTYGVTRHEVAAMSNGRVALSTSEVDDSTLEKFRIYYLDDTMKKVGGPATLNGEGFAQGTFKAYARAIAGMKSGSLAIYRDGNVEHLLLQPLNAKAKLVGRPIQLDSTPIPKPAFGTDLLYFSVHAARLKDDRLVAVWTIMETINGVKTQSIRARIMDMAGRPVGPDFLVAPVPVEANFLHFLPKVVPLENGGFVVNWVRDEFTFVRTYWFRVYDSKGKPGAAVQIGGTGFLLGTGFTYAALADGSLVTLYAQGGAIWAVGLPKGGLN